MAIKERITSVRSQFTVFCANLQNLGQYPVAPEPSLHAAAPLAALMREQARGETEERSDSTTEAAETSVDASAERLGISAQDRQDFYPAKMPPPADYPSWDPRLDGEALEKEKRVVFDMLDEFETDPPFTIQRLAELVLRPTQHYRSRAKYLGALRRVLLVTATTVNVAEQSSAQEGATAHGEGAQDGAWPYRPRSSSHHDTIYSPIPFLQDQEEPETKEVPHEKPEVATLPVDNSSAVTSAADYLGIPDGRVDELDEQLDGRTHAVSNAVHPLSAATNLSQRRAPGAEPQEANTPKRARRESDTDKPDK